jgi:hypothetical protein
MADGASLTLFIHGTMALRIFEEDAKILLPPKETAP